MSPWQAFGIGIGLGLGAGITPGPLLGLVINETLRGGWRSGILVALAPPVADSAIIALCFLVLMHLPELFFSVLSIAGGFYVMLLAWETLRTAGSLQTLTHEATHRAWHSMCRGIVVNVLNPHPYLFWLTVGGPLLAQSYQQAALAPIVGFLGGFYGCLVGSKMLLALLVHGSRTRLQGRTYHFAIRASAGFLLFFGVLLLWKGTRELWR